MMQIIIPVVSMAALGLAFGAGLAYALKIFGIEVDPTVALILTRLPGANCGACGKAGCAGFAEALRKGEAIPSSCAVTNEEARRAIADILGIEYSPKIKKIAIVHCNGGKLAKEKFVYRGIKNCKAATLLFSGYKMCDFGCLGLGDCVEACPFDAIKMNENDIPVIDPQKCTACGKCVATCPKKLFTLEKSDKKGLLIVACNSHDKGARVKQICSVGCIGCGICQKLSSGVFEVKDNLAAVDYNKPAEGIDWEKIINGCPTKTIVKQVKKEASCQVL